MTQALAGRVWAVSNYTPWGPAALSGPKRWLSLSLNSSLLSVSLRTKCRETARVGLISYQVAQDVQSPSARRASHTMGKKKQAAARLLAGEAAVATAMAAAEASAMRKQKKPKQRPPQKSAKANLPRSSNSLVNSRSGNSPNTGAGNPAHQGYSLPSLNAATVAYGMSLMNPWDPECNGAKVISPVDEDSGVINTVVKLVAGAPSVADPGAGNIAYDQTGSGAFVARPGGLFMSYAYTPGQQYLGWTDPGSEDPTESGGMNIFSPAGGGDVVLNLNVGWGGTTSAAPTTQLYPNYSPSAPCWMSLPEATTIQGLASKKRVVSAGAIIKYIGPPITGSGLLAVGLVPWDQFTSIEETINTTGTKFYPTGITWSKLITLEGVKVIPAMEGAHVSWYPYDASGTLYQESIATYLSTSDISVPTLDPEKTKRLTPAEARRNLRGNVGGRKPDIASGKIRTNFVHPGVRVASSGSATSTARTATKNKTKVGVAPSFGQPYDDYIGRSFGLPFPMDGDQMEIGAFTSAVAVASDFMNQADPANPVFIDQVNLAAIAAMEMRPCQGQPLLVIMWNGVAPSNQAGIDPAWAANLFEIEYYVNHEIIPDQSTFRIAQIPATPAMVGSPATAIKAATVLSQPAPGAPPPAASTWQKFKKWAAGAWDTAKEIGGYVAKGYQVAQAVGDALAMFA